MANLYKLSNQTKNYEWGSFNLIPEFLSMECTGEPFAEIWMGTHSAAPSKVTDSLIPLSDIAGELPFLFKMLAVEKPLSVQAHPDKEKAQLGFQKENKNNIPLDSSLRNYKDINHKPEIVCAITQFTTMAGFRQPKDIIKSLKLILDNIQSNKSLIKSLPSLINSLNSLITALTEPMPLKKFLSVLFKLSKNEVQDIYSFFLQNEWQEHGGLIKNLALCYPCDPAVLSPLYLNLITLQPKEAVFIPCGVAHSHISGFAIELMASSDNVLRAGLTPKHIDIDELFKILDFTPFLPEIIKPNILENFTGRFDYPVPVNDFVLSYINTNGRINLNSPVICAVTEGSLLVLLEDEECVFSKGDSFFIGNIENDDKIIFKGDFAVYAACGQKVSI